MNKAEITATPGETRARGAQNGNKNAELHGHYALKNAVKGLGGRLIDKRYRVGKALASWKADLVRDLGGNISTQEQALVDLAVKSKLILDSIDAWLLTQRSLVNIRKRALLPVVRERQQLADGLARYLAQLGMKRIAHEQSLEDLLLSDETDKPARQDSPDATHGAGGKADQPRKVNGTFSTNVGSEGGENGDD